jgi:ferredoxin
MSTAITTSCINCGACEPECPNTAIYEGGARFEWSGAVHAPLAADVFFIVPEKCTECVGFYEREQCAAVCPVDCCVPDPGNPEAEAVLIERARRLHPELAIADPYPSRFGAARSGV